MPRTKQLYHFTSAKYALEAISMRRLKAAELDKTNDPYEALAVCLSSDKDRKQFEILREKFVKAINVVCFSENNRNPLLWSHYADKCKGICLGFDVIIYEEGKKNYARKVNYKRNKLTLHDIGLGYISDKLTIKDTDKARDLVYTKSTYWQYEDEWRIMTGGSKKPDPVTNLRFITFSDQLTLREILVGFRCEEENIQHRLESLIFDHAYDPLPEIFPTRLSSSTFDVVMVT